MNHSNIFKKSAVALAAVGLFASASAQADSLVLEQDINSALSAAGKASGLC